MKRAVYIILVILLAFLMLALIPLDTSKDNCIEITGTIKSIREGGIKDMVFELKNHKTTYYVNRGFENEFELNKAGKDFIGKEIKLFYAKGWTPLAPFGTTSKHISHAIVNDSVIHSDW